MAADVAETTRYRASAQGREEVPVQIPGLLDAHQIIIGPLPQTGQARRPLDDAGTNDLVVSDVLRTNELQVWFISAAPGGYASGARRTTAATQCRLMQRIICGT